MRNERREEREKNSSERVPHPLGRVCQRVRHGGETHGRFFRASERERDMCAERTKHNTRKSESPVEVFHFSTQTTHFSHMSHTPPFLPHLQMQCNLQRAVR